MKFKIMYVILVISLMINVGLVWNTSNVSNINNVSDKAVDIEAMEATFDRIKVALINSEQILASALTTDNPIDFYHNVWQADIRLARAYYETEAISKDVIDEYSVSINSFASFLNEVSHQVSYIQGNMIVNEFKTINSEDRANIEKRSKELKKLNEVLKPLTLNKQNINKLNKHLSQ